MKYTLLLAMISVFAFAKKPADFKIGQDHGRFVDFKRAFHKINYDMNKKEVSVYTEIFFKQTKSGKTIFDLIPKALEANLNGKKVEIKEIKSPNNVTKYKYINQVVEAGEHKLTIKNMIKENVKFKRGTISSAFWMSDLSDRSYLEQYMPANIEYDQYPITFEIELIGNKKEHKIFTNGQMKKLGNNTYKIEHPEYFTSSSLFFHLVPAENYKVLEAQYKSISGKTFPVILYKKPTLLSISLETLKNKTFSILKELEAKFGAWPHPSLVIYKARLIEEMGGMEYSGATMTSVNALGHEITHSYFARGVMPVDGNSGWLDEAIASWRDNGYKELNARSNLSRTKMAAHSEYRRTTDDQAYTKGAQFMSYLNARLKRFGGLTLFLKELHKNYVHTNITTNDFIRELEKFSGINFQKDFNEYIFGKKGVSHDHRKAKKKAVKNPYHPKLSKEQLLDLL